MQICQIPEIPNLDLVVISPFGSNRTVNQARQSGSWALDEVLFVCSSHISSFVQRVAYMTGSWIRAAPVLQGWIQAGFSILQVASAITWASSPQVSAETRKRFPPLTQEGPKPGIFSSWFPPRLQ